MSQRMEQHVAGCRLRRVCDSVKISDGENQTAGQARCLCGWLVRMRESEKRSEAQAKASCSTNPRVLSGIVAEVCVKCERYVTWRLLSWCSVDVPSVVCVSNESWEDGGRSCLGFRPSSRRGQRHASHGQPSTETNAADVTATPLQRHSGLRMRSASVPA